LQCDSGLIQVSQRPCSRPFTALGTMGLGGICAISL
jgi:hypothetical protein